MPSVFAMANRKTVRADVNPLDKCTIVSIYPQAIREVKHTIQPGVFDINSGSYDKPSLLVVGPSSWFKEINPDEPIIEIVNSSLQIADSIINDYCNGLLACDMAGAMPGLFYVLGDIPLTDIKDKYKGLLDKAKVKQENWYRALVKMADVMWARTNQNPLAISDNMRLAARELAVDKDWLKDYQSIEMARCPACGTMGNPMFPVCAVCKAIINPEKAKELKIQFAQ